MAKKNNIHANNGDDSLLSTDGDDNLRGGTGKDILFGNNGNDSLSVAVVSAGLILTSDDFQSI